MPIKRPPGWLDEGEIMGQICDEIDAKLAADPVAKYEHLKDIGTIRRAREDGLTDAEIEEAYAVTIPPGDRRPAPQGLAAE